MQDLMGGEDTPAEQPRKKAYTSSERSKAAKTGWARAREESFYHQDQPIAGYTYTAERVEWEIKQKMLAAANAEDEESSSDDESDDDSSFILASALRAASACLSFLLLAKSLTSPSD